MKVVRVSELETWQRCQWLWDYKHNYAARRPAEDTNYKVGPTLIGTAVHRGIEVGMLGQGNPVDAAIAWLREAIGEKQAARFEKGIATAIGGVPLEWWQMEKPQVEDGVWVEYDVARGRPVAAGYLSEKGREELAKGSDVSWALIINGTPDFWWYEDGDLMLNDFKTSSKVDEDKLLTYEVFNAQLDYYAVLIQDAFSLLGIVCPPIYKRHVLLSTQGHHLYGTPKLTDRLRVWNRGVMLSVAQQIATPPYLPTRNGLCSFCEFNSVCTVRLTGGDFEGMLREWGGATDVMPGEGE